VPSFSFREHCLFFLEEIINMKNKKYNKVKSLLKKGDINSNKVKPIIIYYDSLLSKFNALDDNIGKSAVYR
jgi:hypothetical protein